ncbi:MAG: 4Fe-4S dicluster domain-containing protein [Deltaproteobacteria bacterium]|nr:MAG: 4Fe-4S dicluster domain-containing protein [Deltaproteobacteria bacterium]
MGRVLPGIRLRPPGALPEEEFAGACVSCFKCGNVCPNDCISFYGPDEGLDKAFTPYIVARERGCILCGECTDVCPTGALQPFEVSREGWVASVKMGVARVNEEMCFSYNMRTCGACYQACPLAGQAIRLGLYETPILNPEECVGCGLCEQACLHLPQAIRVLPLGTTGRRGNT